MDDNATDFVNEINAFNDWLREYGPYVYFDFEESKINDIDPSLIWSSLSLNDEDYIANCYHEEDDCNGFFVATKPYTADEGTLFVTTHVNVQCAANVDCDPDCLSCGGLGYISIDIEELSKELPS
jgi:hypothetical protein